ncbi:hypothetical protein M8C21_005830, partial [Ambrosia artemisiifolia]
MVAAKGLSTFKVRVSGERETRKNGGVRSLKVYEEEDTKVKITGRDHGATETKKSVPVKAEFSRINANCQKEVINKLGKINGKNINSAQTKVGRKVLSDISNSQGIFQKKAATDGSKPGKGKMEKMTYSQRASISLGKDLKVFNCNPKTRGQDTGKGKMERMTYSQRASVSLGKDLKVFNGNSKTRNQDAVANVTRKSAMTYCPPQRKSLPVLKHVDKEEKSDIK